MRLTHIEMSGFRGFRDHSRIDIPHGFLVITGRNGTGKSALIDAIEYVLTGTIAKYVTGAGGKENIHDYVWWRGAGVSAGYSVSIGMRTDDGQPVELVRGRDGRLNVTEARVSELLCDAGFIDSVATVCQTSIIRDEMIAALSWDQTDTARFEFVRSALGARAPVDLGRVLTESVQRGQKLLADKEREGEIASSRLRTSLAELSEAKSTTQQVSDLQEALASLQAVVGRDIPEISELLVVSRRYIATRRSTLERVAPLVSELRRIEEVRANVTSKAYMSELAAAQERLRVTERTHAERLAEVGTAESRLLSEEARNEENASYAALLEHGERLGLDHGKCPLCQAAREVSQYQGALQILRQKLVATAAALLAARNEVAERRRDERTARTQVTTARSEYQRLAEMQSAVNESERLALQTWRVFAGADAALPSSREAEQRIEAERGRLVKLERGIFVLEASQAVDRVARLEGITSTARDEVERINARAASLKAAVAKLKEADKAIKRANAEIVDERLASISPLLSELYYRLRPHRNWRNIDYAIRGDVRRFLSLSVGDGINPQFVFSSGERRAAGWAFLLAVSLSRPWCRWRTLVLDDPVQHIDDFRAIHLVEVLAALRKENRQILCSVEDPELAELLCRRLRSSIDSPGARVELDYDGDFGSYVKKWDLITPLPSAALLSA